MNQFIFLARPIGAEHTSAELYVNGKMLCERDPHPMCITSFPAIEVGQEIEVVNFELTLCDEQTHRYEYVETFRFKGKVIAVDDSGADYIPVCDIWGQYQRLLVQGEVLYGPAPVGNFSVETYLGSFHEVIYSGLA